MLGDAGGDARGEDADLGVWDGTRLLGREEFARRLPELETKAS